MRIELTLSAWKAEVLPLNYIRTAGEICKSYIFDFSAYLHRQLVLKLGGSENWSGRRDSNSRPSPWQGDALPLSHFRIKLVEGGGFEPPKAPLTDLQSAPFSHSGIPPSIKFSRFENPPDFLTSLEPFRVRFPLFL